jgi:FkbM family methyltransferase
MDRRGPFKTQALDILKARGVPIGTILDVGVQHGTFELMAAFPNHFHLLFEPVVEFYPRIETSYAKIKHELIKTAISDQTGTVTLQTSRKLQGMDISHSTMVFDNNPERTGTREVSMQRLDDALAGRQLDAPYLLKIDIDGHEMRALRGATETLKKCSVVIVECVHSTLPERLSYVLNAGFRLFDLAEPCYYDKVYWQSDAIFLRNDMFRTHFTDLGGGAVQPGMYESFR